MTINTFNELNINQNIKKAIEDLNFTTPTAIQEKAIPIILSNKDMIGQAQTGTGKTAAFAIPMIEKIDCDDPTIQSLVLCPTRELAIQVTQEIRKLFKYIENIKIVPVYGGQSYDIQIRALKRRPQIIVGTPGRIIDLMNRSLLKFDNLKLLVLDEADEMLKMGFQEDLETILQTTPSTRQSVMFSATMPKPIISIANKYLKNYELVQIEAQALTLEQIEQSYFVVNNEQKLDLLMRLFDYNNFTTAIVFCNTKKDVDALVVELQSNDYITEGLHGDLKQGQRDRVMNSFRSNNVQILVATDVAARGLDVDDVDAVFNFDIPIEEEVYVHRIGRTGRAGKTGKSFSFITRRQNYQLREIERYINKPIPQGKIPTIEEIKEVQSSSKYNLIKEKLNADNYNHTNILVERLLDEGFTDNQIFNALIDLVSNAEQKVYKEISPVEDHPKRVKREQGRDRQDFKRKSNADNKLPRRTASSEGDNKKVLVLLDAGSKNQVKVTQVLTVLIQNRINKKDIGNIEINKRGTYVELNPKDAQRIAKMGSLTIENQAVSAKIIN